MTHSTFPLGRALLVSDDLPRACVVTAGFSDVTMVDPDRVGEIPPGEEPFGCAVVMAGVLRAGAAVTEVLDPVRARCTSSALILVETTHPDPAAGTDLQVVDQAELGGVEFAVLSSDLGSRLPVSVPPGPDAGGPEAEPVPVPPKEAPPPPTVHTQEPFEERAAELTEERPEKRPGKRPDKRSGRPADRGRVRRGSVSVLGAVAVVVAVAASVVLARLTGTGYVGGVATLLVVGGAGGIGLVLRQQRRAAQRVRRLERVVVTTIADQQRTSQADFRRRVDGGLDRVRTSTRTLTGRIEDQSARLAELERQLSVLTAVSLDTARRVGPPPDSEPFMNPATLAELHQVQALANLFSLAPARGIVPPMGGWAASPDVVAVLVEDLLARRPSLVVECGSGVSTLWLSLIITRYDLPTRIVSLDHDPHFAEQTRQTLRQHGVAAAAEVRVAPLLPSTLPGHPTPWYDPAATTDLSDIGLLFVDGPPDTTGPLARLPAVPVLRDRLAPQCTIVLDDVVRASEQEVAARWRVLLPDFTLEQLPLQKVAARFRRG